MDIIGQLFNQFLSSIGPFFLLLGLLIFVHELGHFLVARFFGVRVETFSLGFGKKILQYKSGDTVYCLSLIPLGGYVKMFGDDPTKEISEDEKKYSFLHQPVWPRIAIVLGGPLMNLFFAMLIFGVIGTIGEPVPGPQLGDISKDSAAFSAGFRSGDTIQKINGDTVEKWKDLKNIIEERPNETLNFTIQRQLSESPVELQAQTNQKKNPFIFSTNRQIGWIEGLQLESKAPVIAISSTEGAAYKAGIRTLDLIKKINETEISYWREIEPALALAVSNNEDLTFVVQNQLAEAPGKKPEERTIEITAPTSGELSALGLTTTELVLYSVRDSSPAKNAGLLPKDRIVSINGENITGWQQLLDTVKNWPDETSVMTLGIFRGGEIISKKLTPKMTELQTPQGQFEKRYTIGISPAILSVPNALITEKAEGILEATWVGIEKSYQWSELIVVSMVRLVQNEVSARNIGGVISIGRVASQSYELGWIAFLKMMAIISINLFLLNLLPVPVLDGGHLVFFTIEAIKGSPLSLRKMEMAQQVGLVLLLSLMVFALFNDIRNLLIAW